ncbi:FAD-binding protein [Blastococcus brunescens]|uniref:FAD-binding protein n=1 Tax=Blastococcus brunescens TaxID=1564165 RepID=A0ABZ1AYH9_9ACTN|nr:FAD-binding protein [Blastococcus sp. BMG 8361]WRL63628.1 FAD-binding protein [Blastococcus sp. BMG 8361]
MTDGRTDPVLSAVLVDESQDALRWLHRHGLRFRLMDERQSYPDAHGRLVFFGGLAVGSAGGGKGLMEQHAEAARQGGVRARYQVRARSLVLSDGRVTG